MQLTTQIKRFLASHRLADGLALLGVVVYFIQAKMHAHAQESILDEGAYLYKGYLYITGRFAPFQDYGPWANHMPLSFLIPGYIQTWFGPGLRTGRYYSIALALLMLLGLWLVAKRLGGRWWAAGAVWALALNPMYSRVYSTAFSQVLVACMLMWVLVLVLKEHAPDWQILLGSALAGLLLLTRVNMALVLPLVIFYVFRQHGRRAGLLATVTGSLPAILGHVLFWPGIMRLWAYWIPASLTPFLNRWRVINMGEASWNPNISLDLRILSFWYGIRFNFVAMVALAAFGWLGFQRKAWKTEFYHRSAMFLSLLTIMLVVFHAWASLSKNYCVFCFQGYLTFFTPVIYLLIVIVFRGWKGSQSIGFTLFACLLILLIAAGIGYGISQELGSRLLELPVPRIKGGRFVGGVAPLWGILESILGMQYQTAKTLVTILVGLVMGIFILLIAGVIHRGAEAQSQSSINFGLLAICVLLAIGLVLSPTTLLGNGYQENDCRGDVIAAEEAAGRHLAETIPAGSQVYWQGTLSVVPLLYAPELNIYPPQINNGYSFNLGGDAEELEKFGFWNADLADHWKQEADFVIIEERRYNSDWKDFLESGQFVEMPRTPTTAPCRGDARLRIFRRVASQ